MDNRPLKFEAKRIFGWTLLKKGELYNGLGDFSYLNRKLRYYRMTAIDSSGFPELLT